MPSPRSATIVPGQAGFYHCISRCVRRSFLCGKDKKTGQNFEHRRPWILDRLRDITRIFSVDVYAYAIMHNHYHVLLYVDPERCSAWSDDEVKERWSRVFAWRRENFEPSKLPEDPTKEQIAKWRERLSSVSWMMQSLNEPIARWSNQEDDVKGHFWESRFECIPVLDNGGLLACMTYVDLNPIRAGIAVDIESSEYTSIKQRLDALKDDESSASLEKDVIQKKTSIQRCMLGPILGGNKHSIRLDIDISEYVQLLRATVADDLLKKEKQMAILESLGISVLSWKKVTSKLLKHFRTAIGNKESSEQFLKDTKRLRHQDTQGRKLLYG